MNRKWAAPVGIALMILLDQLTKFLAYYYLRGNAPLVLIPGVFELQYLENRSAAFGVDPVSILHGFFHFSYFDEHPEAFLTCKMVFFIVLTLVVCAFVFYFYRKLPDKKRVFGLRLSMLMFVSGAVGNCIDRILHRYVIDFFYFKLINFPIFNVADIYVTIGAVFLGILWIFVYKEDDFNE